MLARPDPRSSRTCRVVSPKTVCSITFPGTELRLTGLHFPGSSLQPFLETETETETEVEMGSAR